MFLLTVNGWFPGRFDTLAKAKAEARRRSKKASHNYHIIECRDGTYSLRQSWRRGECFYRDRGQQTWGPIGEVAPGGVYFEPCFTGLPSA